MFPRTLVADLAGILGRDKVTAEPESLDRYSVDGWGVALKWAQAGRRPFRPDVVVTPAATSEVSAVLRYASAAGVPVTARGLGSSVTGQPLPCEGGIVLETSSLTAPLDICAKDFLVTTGAGRRGSELESAVQAEGFTLGHSPQSLHLSSVGGWLATRATGQFSSLYGGIENLVIGMKVVLANGSEVKVQALPRSAFGPDLRALFIGAEGTLGIITEVTLKLFRAADTRTYQAFSLSSVANGLKALRRIMQTGLQPLLLRLYDENESRRIAGEDFDGCLLLTADSGKDGDALAEHVMVHDLVTNSGGTTLGPGLAEAWMSQRFDYSAIGSLIGSDGMYAETIEVAHSWSKIGDLYEALKKELAPLTDSVQAHFSHAYPQGSSLYMIVTGEASSNEDAARRLEEIWDAAMQCTLRLGGVLSHHHGAGIARAKYSKQALGSSFEVLQSVKAALDPKGILNPGKLGLGTLNGPAERPYDVRTDRPGR